MRAPFLTSDASMACAAAQPCHAHEEWPLGSDSQFVEPISRSEMRVRYLPLGDAHGEERESWLGSIIESYETGSFPGSENLLLNSLNADCDVVVIGGNDVKRIAAAYHRSRMMLRQHLVVCVMHGSTASRRASLLRAGFDDVFDVARTPPAEAIARMRAHWSRYEARKRRASERAATLATVRLACDEAALTSGEVKIMLLLCEEPGTPVSRLDLRRAGGSREIEIGENALMMAVSRLRKKLHKGYAIMPHSGGGYVLQVPQKLSPKRVTGRVTIMS